MYQLSFFLSSFLGICPSILKLELLQYRKATTHPDTRHYLHHCFSSVSVIIYRSASGEELNVNQSMGLSINVT